jgi:hypothetical protein
MKKMENQVCELNIVAAHITINSDDNNSGKADTNDYPDQGSRMELENLKTFLFNNMYWSVDKIMASQSKYFREQDIASKVPLGFCQSKHNDSGVRDDFCMPLAGKQGELLWITLAANTKQVKELENELDQSCNKKKSCFQAYMMQVTCLIS